MKTLRDYEELIRAEVSKIDKADPNWTFTVKSFAKDRVRIRWSYLDYLQEKNNCFILQLIPSDDGDDYTLTSRTPDDEMIDGYIVNDGKNLKLYQDSFENGIGKCIRALAYYAHSRY